MKATRRHGEHKHGNSKRFVPPVLVRLIIVEAETMQTEFPTPKRVLFITAHPDDTEFSSGGTIARWTEAGTEVIYVIVTDGSKGSNDPEMTPERLARIREEEQRAAARVLGVSEVVFLGYTDGEVYDTLDLRRDLVRQIRYFRPDLVVTFDPTARFFGSGRINHPDHIAVGHTTLAAVFPLARDRLNFPEHEREGLRPHRVLDVFLVGSNEPNFAVDITDTIERKIEALACHRSQIGSREELAEYIRQRARLMAEGTPYEYAERFRRIVLPG